MEFAIFLPDFLNRNCTEPDAGKLFFYALHICSTLRRYAVA